MELDRHSDKEGDSITDIWVDERKNVFYEIPKKEIKKERE